MGLIAYSNTFDVPFQFDDKSNIVENPAIKDLSYFTEPSRAHQAQLPESIAIGWKTRYIGYLTFAFNYALHGLDVRGYHAANLAIHIINAFLVYWLVLLTFRTPFMSQHPPSSGGVDGPERHPELIALLSALLFVSHPIQTQAVTYVVQRLASLAMLFYVLSLTAYIKARLSERNFLRYAFYALSVVSAVLGMKTKEIVFTLPIAIALYEFLFFRDSLKRRLIYLTPLLLTMLIIPLTLLDMGRPLGEIMGDVEEVARLKTSLSRASYLFTEFSVVVTYLRLILLPVNQNLDYDYPIYTSFLEPRVYLSFLFLASILGLGVFLLYRFRSSDPLLRVASFGIFWFILALSVESSVIPITDVMFEHRLYLPSVGIFMAMGALAGFALGRLKKGKLCTVLVLSAVLVPVTFAVASHQRNAVWQSDVSLWRDTVIKSPMKARPYYNLGNAYSRKGLADEAIASYERSLKTDPNSVKVYNNLGAAYLQKGSIDKAIIYLERALTIDPRHEVTYFNLGLAYMQKGLADKAIENFKAAISINPRYAKAHRNLGDAYMQKGLPDEARRHFDIADSLRLGRAAPEPEGSKPFGSPGLK